MIFTASFARSSVASTLAVILLSSPALALAQTASFKDVPSNHPAFAAVEFVRARGMMTGNPDGTFKPADKFTRAAAAKVLSLTKVTDAEAKGNTEKTYTDIPEGAWYRPYAETARRLGIVSPAASFNGDRPVKLVEFLKMLFASQGIDTSAFSEIMLPLATDVTDTKAWFYPHLRLALASSLIMVSGDGKLTPDRDLTRADVALIVHRLAMYQAGKRAQALLSAEETDLVNVLKMIDAKDVVQAEYASARALVIARGVHQSKPDVPIVQGALKTAEAFRSLVRGYRAGSEGKYDDAITLGKEAWGLAEKAKSLSADLSSLSTQVQTIAKTLADQARKLKDAPAA
jgi:hypothetical protein